MIPLCCSRSQGRVRRAVGRVGSAGYCAGNDSFKNKTLNPFAKPYHHRLHHRARHAGALLRAGSLGIAVSPGGIAGVCIHYLRCSPSHHTTIVLLPLTSHHHLLPPTSHHHLGGSARCALCVTRLPPTVWCACCKSRDVHHTASHVTCVTGHCSHHINPALPFLPRLRGGAST